jgi:hypothetical protein
MTRPTFCILDDLSPPVHGQINSKELCTILINIFFYAQSLYLFSYAWILNIQWLILRKMMDLQHHHNNYTTPPHIGVGPSVWGSPHVRGCCAIIVPVKCRNQIPNLKIKLLWLCKSCTRIITQF